MKSSTRDIVIGAVSGFIMLLATGAIATGINSNNVDISNPSRQKETVGIGEGFVQQNIEQETKAPVIEVKEEKETREIAFNTIYREDNTLAKGSTRVVTEGVNGVKTITYKVTYTDGVETDREKISEEITTQPIDKVVANGTYVKPQAQTNCPNGTYVNSAGNTVCRPSSSNTGGATAICRDGSYSYSQSRRGTCSHHGGVSRWL